MRARPYAVPGRTGQLCGAGGSELEEFTDNFHRRPHNAVGNINSLCTRPHNRVRAITDLLTQGVPLEDVQYLAGYAQLHITRVAPRTRPLRRLTPAPVILAPSRVPATRFAARI
jgi:hypothetical protein